MGTVIRVSNISNIDVHPPSPKLWIWSNFGAVVDMVGRGAGKLNLSLKEPPLPIVRSLDGPSFYNLSKH